MAGQNPNSLVMAGSQLLFIADGGTGAKLYKSDGTSNGTKRIDEDLGAELIVTVLDDEGDGRVTATDLQGEYGRFRHWARTDRIHATSGVIDDPRVNDMIRVAVLDALERGRTRITVRLELVNRTGLDQARDTTSPIGASQDNIRLNIATDLAEAAVRHGVPLAGDWSGAPGATRLIVTPQATTNVRFDLVDEDGGVIAAGQSQYDSRHLDAGTYYLRAYRTDNSVHAHSFTWSMNLPAAGKRGQRSLIPIAMSFMAETAATSSSAMEMLTLCMEVLAAMCSPAMSSLPWQRVRPDAWPVQKFATLIQWRVRQSLMQMQLIRFAT